MSSIVLNTRMASDAVANRLRALKVDNTIRLVKSAVTDATVRRAGALGPALETMSASDNDRGCVVYDAPASAADEEGISNPYLDANPYLDC